MVLRCLAVGRVTVYAQSVAERGWRRLAVEGTRLSVDVINGRTNSTTTVIDPNAKTDLPGSLAVNPFTDNVYVANVISDNVTVIHGPK